MKLGLRRGRPTILVADQHEGVQQDAHQDEIVEERREHLGGAPRRTLPGSTHNINIYIYIYIIIIIIIIIIYIYIYIYI